MRIAIDATATSSQRAGQEGYTFNLIKGLVSVGNENNYFIFAKKEILDELNINKPNFRLIPCNIHSRPIRLLWELFVLPFHIKRYRIGILHSPHYIIPLLNFGWKSVVTIHDMTFFLYPGVHTFSKKLFFRWMISYSIKKADMVICVSESTKRDMMKLLNAPNGKLITVPEAADDIYMPVNNLKSTEEIKQKYRITGKFILYVGVLEPRKNISALIKAFSQLLDKGFNYQLVIAGKKGWDYNQIFEMVKNLKLEDKIIFTGYVPSEDLLFLYNAAKLFVYPSLYEGFGIPVLEAMCCGTPVITSNISSMPEVAGEGAILINPHSIEELRDAMIQCLSNKELSDELRKKGLERAKKFSWEKTARQTIRVFRNVVNM